MIAFAEYELGAAAAHIDEEQGLTGEGGVGIDAAKGPVGLLLAGDDIDLQIRGGLEGGEQLRLVDSVPRRARRDQAGWNCSPLARLGGKTGNRPCRVCDGRRLQAVSGVKAAAEPGLLASFQEWMNAAPGHLGHEEFNGVGADINDRSATESGGGRPGR